MDAKKPSTADILAKIRAQKAAAGAGDAAAESSVKPADSPAVSPVEATPSSSAAPAAKPGSTKDILAAIRAKGAGASASTSTPAAAATSVPASPAASVPAGPRPSVQDMLKAVREGKVGSAPVASAVAVSKPVVTAPPMPSKPVVAKKVDLVRRGFFAAAISTLVFPVATAFNAAWTALATVAGVATLGVARFMFPNVLVEPPSKFKVGPLSDYPLNSVSNKWKDQFGIWIVHTDQYEGRNLIFALASVCTHLGCTPSWLDGEQKFKCPCHGSGFYMTGVNFEGPAPRPLERVGIRIAEGMLEVDKSVKFQEEMGQWVDAASYVEVA